MRWWAWLAAAGLLVGAIVPAAVGAGAAPSPRAVRAAIALPTSMASTGDSITRAFDTGWSSALRERPQDSWSTGTTADVGSQYQRILSAQPAIAGHVYNDAKTGATMASLDGQLAAAAAQHVQYVTVLMGANDVCTSSVSTMTPTSTFTSEFTTALRHFTKTDPGAHVLVASIPDIYRLWSTLHSNVRARLTWHLFHICQSMLAPGNTEAQRQQVRAQEEADNAALASVCSGTFAATCRWDNGATYHLRFPASWVSKVDFFHPSTAGQRALAATLWATGYWPTFA